MIPTNTFTSEPIVSTFISPYNLPYRALKQIVLGGVALNDPSLGRDYQDWEVSYDSVNINVKPTSGNIVFSLPESNILAVSLAFDNNMAVVLCWQKEDGSYLYYFDTITGEYITKPFPDTTSCRLCVDNSKDFYSTSSDVIFGYTLNDNLYYRQQRDRYNTEYLIGPTTRKLRRMAPNIGNRLQFQLL